MHSLFQISLYVSLTGFMSCFQEQKCCCKPLLSVIVFPFLFSFRAFMFCLQIRHGQPGPGTSFSVLSFLFHCKSCHHFVPKWLPDCCFMHWPKSLHVMFNLVHNCLLTPPPIWAAQSLTNEEVISDSLSLLKISVLMINTMCFGKIVPNLACESWNLHSIFSVSSTIHHYLSK